MKQIEFDGEWEGRSRMILKSLSSLFGQKLESVQQLNRFRKGLLLA